MNPVYHLHVVSVEKKIFTGLVKKIQVTGIEGELGILPGHAPLLTLIKPGMVRIIKDCGEEDIIYLSGGILEVQPIVVTVLADSAIHGADLDEMKAIDAKHKAQDDMRDCRTKLDYDEAYAELMKSIAQLRVIELTRKLM